ncbi:hypothetical protein [Pseudomonas sp. MYb118]|uniref:hypothetical protein n=1 Tax=Pseudomonas sp. MYb118 TaxID=1848720 RepID=UPI0034D01F9D
MQAPVRSSYSRSTVIEPENTSTVLALYTRFLQCFVSANAGAADVNIKGSNGSVQATLITQNAGCTMAVHADCTKAKMAKKIK